MKKTLQKLSLLMTLMVFGMTSAWAGTVTDVLNQTLTGISSNSYSSFSGLTSNSDAVYAGQCAGGNSSIQLRSNNNNSGVVTTTSGGTVRKVAVTWESHTATDRTLNVYGSNEAYTDATELYGTPKGDLLGTIVCGTSTELTITGDYAYVAFRSSTGAMYLSEIRIEWEVESGDPDKADVTVKFEGKDSYEVIVGEEFPAPEAYVYVDDEPDYGLSVTYEISDETLAEFVTTAERQTLNILAPGTFTVKAVFAGDETYNPASATCSYKARKAYTSIAEAKEDATTTAVDIQMTFTNVVVTGVKGNEVSIMDEAGTEAIIYGYNLTFQQGQTLNGTVLCSMINYKGEKFEFQGVTANMEGLTVTESEIATPTLSIDGSTAVKLGTPGTLRVSYDGDGEVTVESSDNDVATVEFADGIITVTPVAEGEATITVNTTETENYYAGTASVKITVIVPEVSEEGSEVVTFSSLGYENSYDMTVYEGTDFTVTFDKGEGSNGPKYYTTGSAVRLYSKNTMTISSKKPIYKVELTFVSGNTPTAETASADKGVIEFNGVDATWLVPGQNSITYTETRGSGHDRLAKVKVYFVADYSRTTTAGQFATICLPNAAVVAGATVYEVAGTMVDDFGVAGVILAEVEGLLAAGKPYIIQAAAESVEAVYTGEAVDAPVEAIGLVGNLDEDPLSVPGDMYVLSENTLRQVQGGTATIGQNRAYFDLSSVPEYDAPTTTAAVKVLNVYNNDATAIDAIAAKAAQDGAIFNLAGQQLAAPQKGVNIIGGKKVLVK